MAMLVPCASSGGRFWGRQRLFGWSAGVKADHKTAQPSITILARGWGWEFQHRIIGTAGVVYTSVLGVKSYDYGKIN